MTPSRSFASFGQRFGANLDAEIAKIDISRLCRIGVGAPRGLAGPVLAALVRTIGEHRRARAAEPDPSHPGATGVSTVRARGSSV